MKLKRSLFVCVLIALFSVCYVIMNQHYDELARYPHELNEKQRAQVLEYLDTDAINMLISQKIEPDEFLPFLALEDFNLANTRWYDLAYRTQTENVSKDFIVRFINKYKNEMTYATLQDLITNYSFNSLIRFYDEGDQYQKDSKLLANPRDRYTIVKNKQTMYTYEPNDLVSIGTLPHANIVEGVNDVLIKSEVLSPLEQLCAAAKEINGQECGGMKIIMGYLSYENQIKYYDQAKDKFGEENFTLSWDYPGHSEFQLGYTIQLLPNELENVDSDTNDKTQEDTPSEVEREQEIWLKDNAYKYGFIIRYPKDEENTSGKLYQPYTLRYVGKEMAKDIHNKNLVFDQVNVSKYE